MRAAIASVPGTAVEAVSKLGTAIGLAQAARKIKINKNLRYPTVADRQTTGKIQAAKTGINYLSVFIRF